MPERPPAGRSYREITLAAIIFGVIVGAVMNAAITYAGLKIGFTIVGSSIAAVLGFGVLRGVLRKGSILEVNIAQTIGSAVNTPNSGVIFTVPVLLLLGSQYHFKFGDERFWLLTAACVAGAILGCAFIIPLRKQMLDVERLRFPSAVAVGTILKSPGAGPRKSIVLLVGVVIAMLVYLPVALPGIKVVAPLDQLDALVRREKITDDDAGRTRTLNEWMTAQAAPAEVIARGRLVHERKTASDPADRDAAASALKSAPAIPGVTDAMAEAAYLASAGVTDWAALKSKAAGWAMKPLPGYSDLDWRVRARPDADGALPYSADHDANGTPDLLLTDETLDVGRILGLPPQMLFMFAITPLSLGAGYLTGRAGLLVLAGGILAYIVLTPAAFSMGWLPAEIVASPHDAPEFGRGNFNRPLGIGLLLGGALAGIVASLPAMREAFKSIAVAGRTGKSSDELGLKVLATAAVAAVVLLFLALEFVSDDATGGWLGGLNPHLKHFLIALVGAGWIWFAGIIIAQCTGMTDWSPISGMALVTIVLVMMLAGKDDVVGAVTIGAALCVAITCAADMMADLKTGYMVGGSPRKQQTVELIFTGLGPVISIATVLLIAQTNLQTTGVPMGDGTPTTAPQAQALEAVITGVQGGEMPYALYGFGAVIGALLGLGSFSGLGVLVGLSMYLPLIYILTYGLGCVINMLVSKIKGKAWAEEWGVPLAAGFIVGEAVLALVVNSIVLIRG
ncbi:MAG: hypothetical protein D6693_08915 [Planctomycetota bacterium]|nr:MAG: hypothetical protein D6693_08915 [Planctomycetota bacterium]